jgi:hypothetical protein
MHLGVVGSIDSFVVAAAMTFAGCPGLYRRRAIVGFLALDMLAGYAGSWLGVAVPAGVTIAGLALTVLAFIAARRWPVVYLVLPFLCCLDNLAIGAADPSSLWSVAADGFWSGTLAWAGFSAADFAMRCILQRRSRVLPA